MKRILAFTLALCMLLGLAACAKPATQDPTTPTTVPTTTPTTAPTAPSVPTSYKFEKRLDYGTKEGVPAFFKLLSEQIPDAVTGLNATAEEDCYNITPPGADPKTDLQVFRSYKTGISYIVQDGEITATDEGIMNLLLCDLDKDGKKDIIFTRTQGSATINYVVRAYISATKKYTFLCQTTRTNQWQMLWVVASGADVYFEGKTEEDNNILYPVLRLENVYENNKLSGYVVTGIVGNVVYQDGKAQFVPYEK